MVAAAPNGVLVFGTGRDSQLKQLLWLDRAGKPLASPGPVLRQSGVALSPGDRRIAVDRFGTPFQVWLEEMTSNGLIGSNELRLTNEPLGGTAPVWSPDGKMLAFTGSDGNLYRKGASGSGKEELLLKTGSRKTASDWSRDGRFLFYTEVGAETQGDIWVLPNPLGPAGESKPYPFLQTAADESQAQLSPDGRWVAYASNESGISEIYVRPFPTGEGRWKVSIKQSREPRWRGDGKELFYLEDEDYPDTNLMVLPVTSGTNGSFSPGAPLMLFKRSLRIRVQDENAFQYAASADGQRFLVLAKPDVQETIHVLTNWTQQLEKKK